MPLFCCHSKKKLLTASPCPVQLRIFSRRIWSGFVSSCMCVRSIRNRVKDIQKVRTRRNLLFASKCQQNKAVAPLLDSKRGRFHMLFISIWSKVNTSVSSTTNSCTENHSKLYTSNLWIHSHYWSPFSSIGMNLTLIFFFNNKRCLQISFWIKAENSERIE